MLASATTRPAPAAAPPSRATAASPDALLHVHAGVRPAEVRAALDALRQIPVADRALLASAGIRIELLPVARLEEHMVGATQVQQLGTGPWTPTSIRIAAHAGLDRSPTSHVVAHEVGHAVEVLRRQDRSELAAERYVQRVLRSSADQAITAARLRSEHAGPTRHAAHGGSGDRASSLPLGLGVAAALALTAIGILAAT